MELRTVYNTFNSADANLLCGRLEAAGFDSSIQGEMAGMTLGAYSSIGGIRILVPDDQADEARALIEAELKAREEPSS
jgi:hypothetical protein